MRGSVTAVDVARQRCRDVLTDGCISHLGGLSVDRILTVRVVPPNHVSRYELSLSVPPPCLAGKDLLSPWSDLGRWAVAAHRFAKLPVNQPAGFFIVSLGH